MLVELSHTRTHSSQMTFELRSIIVLAYKSHYFYVLLTGQIQQTSNSYVSFDYSVIMTLLTAQVEDAIEDGKPTRLFQRYLLFKRPSPRFVKKV